MINSMTAFYRETLQDVSGELVWEISAVNHRYLELRVRLPEELRMLESTVRTIMHQRVRRGKVELGLRFTPASTSAHKIKVDRTLVQMLLKTSDELIQQGCQDRRLDAFELMRWPGVIRSEGMDHEEVGKAALCALERALDGFLAMRQREGERLAGLILQRCDLIEKSVAKVKQRLPVILATTRQKVLDRCEELKVNLDPDRLEQELVMLALKMDVAEEMDRLLGHVQEVRHLLASEKPVGRQLDFLMQELNREANTLGSKSSDLETTKESVELKVLIEQMREQVQNIE